MNIATGPMAPDVAGLDLSSAESGSKATDLTVFR